MLRLGHQGTHKIPHFKDSHDMKSYSVSPVSSKLLTCQLRAGGVGPPGLIWWHNNKGAYNRVSFKFNCIKISFLGERLNFEDSHILILVLSVLKPLLNCNLRK